MGTPWTKLKQLGPFLFHSKSKYRIHSPFVFNFLKEFEKTSEKELPNYKVVERLRKKTQRRKDQISYKQRGGGSQVIGFAKQYTISSILNSAVSSSSKSHFIYQLAKYLKPQVIIEIGTSLGFNSIYLSQLPNTKYVGYEPVKELFDFVESEIKPLQKENSLHIINSDFQSSLSEQLTTKKQRVFIYFDGDHTTKGVTDLLAILSRHAMKEIFVLMDDIRWNNDMFKAWQKIIANPSYKLTQDFFQLGLFSNNDKFQTEHFKIFNLKVLYSLVK